MIEDAEKLITNANNVTTDTCSLASSSQRENSNMVYESENLEKSDNLFNKIVNMTINHAGYELNTVTASDTQVDIESNQEKVTHTNNENIDQTLLRSRTIREVSVSPIPKEPMIGKIEMAASTLMMPAVQEIFAEAMPSNARNP